MRAYKVFYAEEYEHPDDIEVVKEGALIKYAMCEGRIYEGTMEQFLKEHPNGIQTEQDAVDVLLEDGYYVERVKVYE